MLGRRLAVVSGLAVCDYLLWNWSLNSNHDAIALASGLTLPLLALALLWLLVLTGGRLIARYPTRRATRAAVVRRTASSPASARAAQGASAVAAPEETAPAKRPAPAASGKIAA